MKNFLFIILLSSISYISYAQDLEWRYFSPFPFAEEYRLKKGINGENYVINSADELYKITECSFDEIEFISPDPSYNFIYGFGSELSMINDSTWFVNFFNSYYTSDGGKSYLTSVGFITLSKVQFLTEDMAFGIRLQGPFFSLVKSVDKGMTWENLYQTDATFRFDLVNENEIYIEKQDTIFYTDNSGIDWSIMNDSFLGDIDFVSDSLMLSKHNSSIRVSTDHGQTFEEVGHFEKQLTGISPAISHIHYINEKTWIVLYFELLYFTEDGGETWEEYFPFEKELTFLSQVFQLNDNEIFLSTTSDGFHVFDLELKQITNCFTFSHNLNLVRSVSMIDDSTFYILENTWVRNLLYKSTDTLQTISLHAELPKTSTLPILNSKMKFRNDKSYYIAEDTLYVSEQPYNQWEVIKAFGENFIADFEILNNGSFVVINYDSIFLSQDNGQNWTANPHIDLVENQSVFEVFKGEEDSYWLGYLKFSDNNLSFVKYDTSGPIDTLLLNLNLEDLAHVSYLDNKLYISTDLVNRVYHEEDKTLETLCSFGNRSIIKVISEDSICLLYTSPSPRD